MKYRRLGRTNLNVSVIGVGCASGLRSQQLGPALFKRYREELPAIVHKLLELGGNFVATSASYHDTEEILGRALRGRRNKTLIFTATGSREVKQVVADCHRSLMRFQTEWIDGYFAHGGWGDGFYEAAVKLKEQGKIRFIGMSCHVPATHRARGFYAGLGTAQQVPACTGCRRCERACPNRLSIVEKLKEAHALLA
jgi:predicted aldo/keto reductase-like oxidoreductase